jgi:hypothetical protein
MSAPPLHPLTIARELGDKGMVAHLLSPRAANDQYPPDEEEGVRQAVFAFISEHLIALAIGFFLGGLSFAGVALMIVRLRHG